jgi:hypothetical protein
MRTNSIFAFPQGGFYARAQALQDIAPALPTVGIAE